MAGPAFFLALLCLLNLIVAMPTNHAETGQLNSRDTEIAGLNLTAAFGNNYALVCDEDRWLTTFCAGSPSYYYCDSRGGLRRNRMTYSCEGTCRCQNLYPPCIVKMGSYFCSRDEEHAPTQADANEAMDETDNTTNA